MANDLATQIVDDEQLQITGNSDRILIADDDELIITFLRDCLRENGYYPLISRDGPETLQMIEAQKPDLVILDIIMPGLDGFEVISRLRSFSEIPVIMLSARRDVEDKIKSLTLGADDYLTKPFSADELIARIEALIRRSRTEGLTRSENLYFSGDFMVNFRSKQVFISSHEIQLTNTEFSILKELVLAKGKTLSHDQLLRNVWGPEYQHEREYLHVYINRIRSKLKPDESSRINIVTVPRIGYCLQCQP
jgi:two-component system KDP operon response regulator KdpE